MLYRAATSSFALDLRSQWSPGAVCSFLRHLRPFLLYQSRKFIWGGGYNAARSLISRDIADNCTTRIHQPKSAAEIYMGNTFVSCDLKSNLRSSVNMLVLFKKYTIDIKITFVQSRINLCQKTL